MQSTTTPQKATQLSNFTHKPADQSGSTLLQLPREILTQILRCLLTSVEPLSLQHGLQVETSRIQYCEPPLPEEQSQMTWSYPVESLREMRNKYRENEAVLAASKANSRPNFHLAPQIMRCSQSLYTTAYSVLYSENTLSVLFIEESCRILRATWSHYEPWRTFEEDNWIARMPPSTVSRYTCLGEAEDQFLEAEAYEALRKIRNVRLQFMFSDNFTAKLAERCRRLGDALRGKVVSVDAPWVSFAAVKLAGERWWYHSVCLQESSKLMDFDRFRAAQILRCTSIRFAHINPLDQERLAHIITSDQPSFNTYGNAFNLVNDVSRLSVLRIAFATSGVEPPLDERIDDGGLLNVSLSYDPVVYGKARVNYLNTLETFLLKDYMDDFVRFQDAQVSDSEEIESAERYLSQVEASLYESFNDSKVPDNEFQEQLSLPNLVRRHAESRVQELRRSRDENRRRAEECSEQTIRDLFKRAIEPTRKIQDQMNGGDSAYVVVEFER